MHLASIRIITADIQTLLSFYWEITGIKPIQYTADFAAFSTRSSTLAIGSTNTLKFFGGDAVAQPAKNRSVIVEFLVDDVEKDYERLSLFLKEYLVQPPTIMPWGNKSLLFRDPDGNLVNFFTPVTEQARKKFRLNA